MMMNKSTPKKTRPPDAVQWLPAEHLGQLAVDATLRPWLIGKGLLTLRIKTACGERFRLRQLEQWTGLLSHAQKWALRTSDNAGLYREVELCCADRVWVFAQTVVPDSTLCVHPWLAELGDASLGETLSELSGVQRSPYQYARLPAHDELAVRALCEAELESDGVWARRSRIELRGAPLLVQELFLPATGRT